jgi:putative ABC transport system ATP-binding protein
VSTGAGIRLRLQGVGVDIGGRPVLDRIDLVLEAGELVAVTGPSGSGKTILCLVLAGALPATRGIVRLEGWQASGGSPAGSDEASSYAGSEAGSYAGSDAAGLVLQTHGLVQGLTATENVALPLQARRIPRAEAAARTAQALADVGLEKHAARPVDGLSGGERQRVGIARAFALDPLVLVADEPTAELDPTNRERVLRMLRAHAAKGRIVVIASDDPEIVNSCGRTVVLEHGMLAYPWAAAPVAG